MSYTDKIKEKLNAIYVKMNTPSLDEKANFFRLLAVSQKAWLGVRDSLKALQQWESNPWMLLILTDMIEKLTEWASLAEAMEYHDTFFKTDEIELVRSTEITGNMTETLEEIAVQLESSQEISAKVKKASLMPILLIVFTIIAVIVLLILVFPTIIDMYESVDSLPWITQFYLNMSDWLQINWYYLVIAVAGVIVGYKLLYNNVLVFKMLIDKLLLVMPIVKDVVKLYYISRFTSLLAQFYEAWVSPVISFKLLAWIFDNFHYKKKMVEIRNSINAWFSIYDSMEWSELFDAILIQIINVWENTWSLPSVLKRVAPFYEMQLKNKIDALVATMEPLLMAFVACVIGSLLWAIYLPMADMVNQIW